MELCPPSCLYQVWAGRNAWGLNKPGCRTCHWMQLSWRQRDFNFVFFFSIFYAPTTTDNRWKLLFCHMWLWETGQKDLMVPFEVHYRSKWCSFPTTLTKRLAGRGVPPGCPNPEPISDQKMSFSTPVFRPDLKNQTWPLDRIYVIIP